ncbi:sugar transferase [Spirosoma sp. KNUC1025]|uniref:sugar transferase n=1 Tax=Spirosoma sp. KNUC1025 TaxID=2894082 RepID=UPI00386FD04E|nr:sugar transferase [Spirosoma sp. KNUC1025]
MKMKDNYVKDVSISSAELELLHASLNSKSLQLVLKRIFDIVFSAMIIMITSPVMLLTALLIKITSKGPVLYSQYRVGLNGHHFKCYKFRSMNYNNSVINSKHTDVILSESTGIIKKSKNDSRITSVGKIIRKSSIDELPQFFNVLKGDMSVIGPRPLVPSMLTHYPQFYNVRCLIKPGISGLWQIRDREHNTSAEFMFVHDTEYLKKFNLLLDLKIIFITPISVISGKGAY